MSLLSVLIFQPLITALLLWVTKAPNYYVRIVSLISSLATLVLTLLLFSGYTDAGGMQFYEKIPWIKNYGITYSIGVDGYSIAIMLLIAIVIPVTFIYMQGRSKRTMFLAMLFAQGGATGALFSLDMILFYLFWETMLLPIFVMIGFYGEEAPMKVALRVTLYTIFGSMSMLFAILLLGVYHHEMTQVWSFDLLDLKLLHQHHKLPVWAFIAFLLAFLIKIPLIGFHGWLKSTYESAPVPTIVILSGIMAKLGVYAIYRFIFILFPDLIALAAPYMILLGIAGMIYFGLIALMQENLKILFAYSSASHMALIIVGLFSLNLYAEAGSLYLITSHALATVGIYLLLGIIFEQSGTYRIGELSGIIKKAPWLASLFVLFALSIVGIPGSSGFVAELLIIIGTFQKSVVLGGLSALTVLVAMTFVLWVLQRIIFGPPSESLGTFREIPLWDGIALSFVLVIIFAMGVKPDLFMQIFEPTLTASLAELQGVTR